MIQMMERLLLMADLCPPIDTDWLRTNIGLVDQSPAIICLLCV